MRLLNWIASSPIRPVTLTTTPQRYIHDDYHGSHQRVLRPVAPWAGVGSSGYGRRRPLRVKNTSNPLSNRPCEVSYDQRMLPSTDVVWDRPGWIRTPDIRRERQFVSVSPGFPVSRFTPNFSHYPGRRHVFCRGKSKLIGLLPPSFALNCLHNVLSCSKLYEHSWKDWFIG